MKNWSLLFILILCSFIAKAQTPELKESHTNQEEVSKLKIKVFPNPATNVVNILGLTNSNKADIIISDISGTVVLKRQWAIRNNAISIPIPNLTGGIYVVRINSNEQKIQTKFYKK